MDIPNLQKSAWHFMRLAQKLPERLSIHIIWVNIAALG